MNKTVPSENAALARTHHRVLVLEGGCNFRDLGGYPAAHGCVTRFGHLFRSGVLTYLTESDKARLAALGIRSICDLRRTDEIASEPTQWPTEIRISSWPEDAALGAIQRAAGWEKAQTGIEAAEALCQAYRGMPVWLRPQLRGIFQNLLAGELPLVFHCAAGKDRTGFCAAVLLHVLGVPREVILEDFALTNEAVDLYSFSLTNRRAGLGLTDERHPLELMPPSVRAALLAADHSYLFAAFDQLDRDYGSVDDYVTNALEVSDRDIALLQERLLERP